MPLPFVKACYPVGAQPEAEVPGLTGPATALPLVGPVGRDQAAPMAEGHSEGRFLGCGFGAGVDELVADGRVLCPGRNQPPTQHGEAAAVRCGAQDGHVVARGDVVAGLQVQGRADEIHQLAQLCP